MSVGFVVHYPEAQFQHEFFYVFLITAIMFSRVPSRKIGKIEIVAESIWAQVRLCYRGSSFQYEIELRLYGRKRRCEQKIDVDIFGSE